MRMACLLCALAGLALLSCGEKSAQPPAPTNAPAASSSPAEAPAGYLGALSKGQQTALKTVDTTKLNQAIQLFNVDRGRNPKDLNELVQEKYISEIPPAPYGMKLVYDAAAGTVKVVKQ